VLLRQLLQQVSPDDVLVLDAGVRGDALRDPEVLVTAAAEVAALVTVRVERPLEVVHALPR
jgi:hypothetical protein